MDWDKIWEKIKDVPGDFAEFGVYEGGETLRIAKLRHTWAWDTFAGMPDDGYIPELDKNNPPGKWMPAGDVVKKLKDAGNITPVVGKYSETIPAFDHPEVRFAFVHIDCDHYWAYKRVLEFVAPRMSPGGIIRMDDLGDCDGAKKAAEEWSAANGKKIEENQYIYF